MPQQQRQTNNAKKKKGRKPAHQNAFAYKHNPKSKLTQKILESPNVHVCRRCHDKIEWRKQYRKYKPRTKQPGKCNECQKRNVYMAYHTICESCTRTSAKAKLLLESSSGGNGYRVCGVCVKEVALPDPEDETGHDDVLQSLGKIRLRERKAIERQLAKEGQDQHSDEDEGGGSDDEQGGGGQGLRSSEECGSGDDESERDGSRGNSNSDESEKERESTSSVHCSQSRDHLNENDPFLEAIGGADKLVTGLEYQKLLLAKQSEA